MSNMKVGIVLLNWNGLSDTLECLESLYQQKYNNFVVVVVDNNSQESIEPLERKFPLAVFIKNNINEGFCRGNNIGIRECVNLGCEYIWILNNDTVVASNCLELLVAALDVNNQIAGVTNRINCYNDHNMCWFAGGVFHQGIPAHRDYYASIFSESYPLFSTEYLSGCSFLARTTVLVELGGFEERFFCYVEDVDLSLRMLKLGHMLAYEDSALVFHKVSRATKSQSHIKLYYKHRNMLSFLRKHRGQGATVLRWWVTSLRTIASLVIKQRQFKASLYLFRGLVHGQLNKLGCLERESSQIPIFNDTQR